MSMIDAKIEELKKGYDIEVLKLCKWCTDRAISKTGALIKYGSGFGEIQADKITTIFTQIKLLEGVRSDDTDGRQ